MTGVLDVEDAEQRLSRLQNAFQRLNNTTHSKPAHNSLGFLDADFRPQFIPPPTDLLSRVQAFLPALEASNALLSSQDPTHIDIEHVDSESGPYIEMNIGLGVFDVTGSTSPFNVNVSDTPTFPLPKSPSASSSDSSTSTTGSSSTSSDDWDSDESSDVEIITSFKPVRPVKPLPRRAIRQKQARLHPSIVVLGGNNAASDCGALNGEEG
ncbi:hypothetical protein C0993_006019 [Termitomyces sp. T159_Od127]|nr:hypothetical protein C0993_006019 [Termitomyces sp. T159_Od127]